MTDREIEGRLSRAMGHAAPERLDDLLKARAARRAEEGGTNSAPPRPGQTRHTWRNLVLAAAAALLLVFSGGFAGWQYANSPDSVVAIDVNPSIQITVSRAEKVLSYTALNAGGADILGDMDLRGARLNVAVNALIGSMLRLGYIDELRNSILITVENGDADKAQRLQAELTAGVSGLLEESAVHAAVVGQTLTEKDDALSAQALEYGISEGKASLIRRILEVDPALAFADLASLPVNDLNLLLAAKQADPAGMNLTGRVSDKAYIGLERAGALALAEYPGARIRELELDYDEHRMIYECELLWNGVEVELKLDALTGEILKRKVEGNGVAAPSPVPTPVPEAGAVPTPAPTPGAVPAPAPTPTPASSRSPYLTEEEAKALVLAKIPGAQFTKFKFDHDDGVDLYEGEAVLDGMEYEFELDAVTGVFLDWDSEPLDDD